VGPDAAVLQVPEPFGWDPEDGATSITDEGGFAVIESCDQGAEAPAGQCWVAATSRTLVSAGAPTATSILRLFADGATGTVTVRTPSSY